jgi:hypothetical protein
MSPSLPGVSLFDQFAKKSDRGCRRDPTGWYITGERASDYLVSGSENLASIESVHSKTRPESVELNHCSEVPLKGGEHIVMTAEIKAENVLDYANLHLKARDSHMQRIDLKSKSFRGTFEWKTYAVEMIVPYGVETLVYGFTFESQGKAWIRNVRFTVVSQ